TEEWTARSQRSLCWRPPWSNAKLEPEEAIEDADLRIRVQAVRRARRSGAVLQGRAPHRVPGVRRALAQGVRARRHRPQGKRLLQDRQPVGGRRLQGRQEEGVGQRAVLVILRELVVLGELV